MGHAVAVVGGGAWGTALARLIAGQGVATSMWTLEPETAASINDRHVNTTFLPDIELPEHLLATTDLEAATAGADVVVSAVPTQHVRSVFEGRADVLRDARFIVSVSKGIEVDTLMTPTEVLAEVVPDDLVDRLVTLSGPSFAKEVGLDHPTAVVAASRSIEAARTIRDLFSTHTFRVYSSSDVVSVEIGGALKNVIAIGAGISHGLGYAQNTRAALISRGLAEMMRVGVARGGEALTFAGLSGIGDLVLTCSGDLSRNRAVGQQLGEGRTLSEIVAATHTVAEGVKTTLAARRLAEASGIEMPITEQIHRVLYDDEDPAHALDLLMDRTLRDERDA